MQNELSRICLYFHTNNSLYQLPVWQTYVPVYGKNKLSRCQKAHNKISCSDFQVDLLMNFLCHSLAAVLSFPYCIGSCGEDLLSVCLEKIQSQQLVEVQAKDFHKTQHVHYLTAKQMFVRYSKEKAEG